MIRAKYRVDNFMRKYKRIATTPKKAVRVGILDGVVEPDGTPTVEVAKMNYFGAKGIPARPFLKDGLLFNFERIKEVWGEWIEAETVSAEKALRGAHKLGVEAVTAIQSFVRGGGYRESKPNSPVTKAIKDSDNPLIDSGTMISSVAYSVEK